MYIAESISIVEWIGDTTDFIGISLGDTLELRCTSIGNPIPSIVWWRDNLAVEEQTADVQSRVWNCSRESTLRIVDMRYAYKLLHTLAVAEL